MQAATAPASIRQDAIGVIATRVGRPFSLQRRLTEVGDAAFVAEVLLALEARFHVDLDDYWLAGSIGELAAMVERKAGALERLKANGQTILDLMDEADRACRALSLARARANAPLFPRLTADNRRRRARRARRDRLLPNLRRNLGRALVLALLVWSVGVVGYGALQWL